jgi:hypothetical protein
MQSALCSLSFSIHLGPISQYCLLNTHVQTVVRVNINLLRSRSGADMPASVHGPTERLPAKYSPKLLLA